MSFDDNCSIWTLFVSNKNKNGTYRCMNVENDQIINLDVNGLLQSHKIFIIDKTKSRTTINNTLDN